MAVGNDRISLYFGSPMQGAADNIRNPILSIIDGAQSSLFISTQQLEDMAIVQAIVQARKRGVRCRIALESEYMSERRMAVDPWKISGRNERNREVLSVLFRCKIPVRLDRSSRLLHSNFIVADYTNDDSATILLTSANFTPSGLDRYFNSAITVRSEPLARAFYDEFKGIWADSWSGTITPSEPPEENIDDVTVRVIFGPKHQPEMEVMKHIAKAQQSVKFAMFTFSKTSGIDDGLIAAARNINVRGIIDRNQAAQRWAATHDLSAAGVQVRWTKVKEKLHHKLVTFDDNAFVLGTFNFTRSAWFSHETLILIKRNTAAPAAQLMTSLVGAATQEVDRIWELSEA